MNYCNDPNCDCNYHAPLSEVGTEEYHRGVEDHRRIETTLAPYPKPVGEVFYLEFLYGESKKNIEGKPNRYQILKMQNKPG